MRKKVGIVSIIIVITIFISLFVLNNRLAKEIDNIKTSLDYGYEFYCTDEFLDVLNDESNNIFSNFIRRNKLRNMLNDNSCYKHNGQTSAFYIFTEKNDGLELVPEEGYVKAQVVFIDNNGNLTNDYDAKIKIRGNSTSAGEKKPYNIKFSEKQDLLGFGFAKKWCLLAELFDKTMIRNKTFLDLGLRLGLDNTSNSQYVEVYMDQTYIGCYLLTEAVETGKSRVNIDEDNGEFLLELEAGREEEDVTYYVTKHKIRFAYSAPEEPTDEQRKKIEPLIDQFDEALSSGDINKIKPLIDLDSFINVYLISELSKPVDFGYSSVYFYYKDNKFYAGPIWDFDLSSGNVSKKHYPEYWNDGDFVDESYDGYFARNVNIVYSMLLKCPEVEQLYRESLFTNKDVLINITENEGYIDSLVKDYRWIIEKNYSNDIVDSIQWGIDCKYSPYAADPEKDWDKDVLVLKKWISNRVDWLLKN